MPFVHFAVVWVGPAVAPVLRSAHFPSTALAFSTWISKRPVAKLTFDQICCQAKWMCPTQQIRRWTKLNPAVSFSALLPCSPLFHQSVDIPLAADCCSTTVDSPSICTTELKTILFGNDPHSVTASEEPQWKGWRFQAAKAPCDCLTFLQLSSHCMYILKGFPLMAFSGSRLEPDLL